MPGGKRVISTSRVRDRPEAGPLSRAQKDERPPAAVPHPHSDCPLLAFVGSPDALVFGADLPETHLWERYVTKVSL